MGSEKLKKLIQKEINAIQQIPIDGQLEKAVDLIHHCVHDREGKVIVSGVGKAGQIGMKLATTLCSTGTSACFLHPLEAQHGDLGLIQSKDILFLFSNSGETREILELVHQVNALHDGVPVLVLTKNTGSSLAKISTITIHTGETVEICPLGLTPTTSTTVMTVIGDLLVVLLMEKIAFTKKAYGLRHHKGYLGKKARQ